MTKDDISDIRITFPSWLKGPVKASASVHLSCGLIIRSWKVMKNREDELYVSPPAFPPKRDSQEKSQDGKKKGWFDICFFLEKEDRELFQTLVLDKYYEALEGQGEGSESEVGYW